MQCANCKNKILGGDYFKTAYGDWLCGDCWDDYLNSEAGMLEYLIIICYGSSSVEDYDADFLYEVVKSYKINYDKLALTEEQRLKLEQKAKELGLL
jgi:hypothetical protein